MDNIELLRASWEPVARGEADDYQPIYDVMADDVVYENWAGRINGKQGVVDYFTNIAKLFEFWPFEVPNQYFADGDRVVISSEEAIKDLRTGETARGDWAWMIDMREGRMARIAHYVNVGLIMRALEAGYERTGNAAAG